MKYFIIIFALLLWAGASPAATLQFAWTANDPAEQVTGYHLYKDCGENPACIVAVIRNPAAVSYSYTLTDKKSHAFSLTAFREEEDGTVTESGQSTYAIYTPAKLAVKPVGGLTIK